MNDEPKMDGEILYRMYRHKLGVQGYHGSDDWDDLTGRQQKAWQGLAEMLEWKGEIADRIET